MLAHRTARGLAIAILLLLDLAPSAMAKTISMSVEVRATMRQGSLAVALTVANSGDEAAASVVPTVRFGGKEVRGQGRESLGPGERMESAVEVPSTSAPGQWPLVTIVDYSDANGYPFQALQVALVSSPGAVPSLVVVLDVEAAPVTDSGSIRARLKSLSEVPRTAQLRFIAPRGLEVSPATHSLALEPWADAQVKAQVFNRAALVGSRYPVFVTVEYDEAGTHHSAVAHGMVEIREATRRRAWYPLAVAGVLTAIWIAFLVRRRLRGTPPPPS